MDKKKDNQIIIRIICVIASFAFWLYIANSENPERDGRIIVPVELENIDVLGKSKLALLSGQKFEVTLRVKGPMLEVNALTASKFLLKADLSKSILTKGINRVPVYVERLPSDIVIMDQESLKVDVILDNLIEKSVPVKVDIPVTTKPGFISSTPVLYPSVVYVSGAEQYVNNVSYVQAKTVLEDIEKDEELNLPLQPMDEAGRVVKNVTISPQIVNVVIPVKRTKTVKINVETIGNIATGMILEGIEAVPATIDIAGEDEVLESITEVNTEPIDLALITEDKTIEVKLILNGFTTVKGENSISVKVNVDNIKQMNLSPKIKFENLGDNLEYTADTDSVSLVLMGAESLMQRITEASIQCTVDLSNLGEGTHSVPISIKVPDGVKIESASPHNIDVVIKKKRQETELENNTGTETNTTHSSEETSTTVE
ncbi:CdaR family protein [Clostridium thermarum]|uniref:CdaR family protein n=1 Tax=Clostridium thermarum TaxID=1716543 RepID=UPI0011202399|nr:CdaR family protein [Clostridium thermarum]